MQTYLTGYTLRANVENLTYHGPWAFGFVGTGNNLDTVITGGGATDTLSGGAGADRLVDYVGRTVDHI
ncbi:protease, partial [Rhizobium ruizarguesonis]